MTLLDLYNELRSVSPGAGADYVVIPTPTTSIYVGRGRNGEAALIIENVSPLQEVDTRIVLAAFTAYRNRRVRLTGVHERSLWALTIEISDPELIPRFYELCSLLVVHYEAGNEVDMWRLVETMARIFRASTIQSRTEIVGFLGELLYIYASSSREDAIGAWRESEVGRFDFQFESYRLDVKTTSLAGRRHVLSLEQVMAVGTDSPFLASIQLREGGRENANSILGNIRSDSTITPSRRMRFEERVATAFGDRGDRAAGFTFDLAVALESIRIFSANEVPRISEAPAGVTGVKFVSDFDFARSVSLRDFEAVGYR